MAKATHLHRVLSHRTARLLAVALPIWLIQAASPVHAQRWTEQKGRWEFTGKMVVRPLQVEHWMEQGYSRERAEELYAEATAYTVRTLGEHVYRYHERMDEYWFNLPQGRSENDIGEELIATGYYRYVCPNWKTYPQSAGSSMNECSDDALLGNQWHHLMIESCAAWQIHTAGSDSVIIGFVDTGMKVGHEDLSDLNEYRREGYNAETEEWESNGGDIGDIGGGYCHGSIVLGLAAATGDNSVGVSGIGWTLRHRMLKTGLTSETELHAMWVSAGAGDRVICSTAGGIAVAWDLWEDNTTAILSSYDVIICQAAGNIASTQYPPFSAMTIVGGTQQNDERWLEGGGEGSPIGDFIDVMAPAADMYSTKCGTTSSYGITGNGGTSYSTPLVAGLCALVWSMDTDLTGADVLDYVFAGCDEIVDYDPDLHGHGRINAFNTLALAAGDLWTRDPYPGEAGVANIFKAAGATNSATVRFYYGSSTGQTAVSGCSNVNVGIANASVLGTATAGANGAARLTASVPAGWAGQTRYLQAVDLSNCRVSNLIEFTFLN